MSGGGSGRKGAISFHFDFSSPYAYFASHDIDAVAAEFGREVRWKPILLGPAFTASGNQPLVMQPLKGGYCRADWERIARLTGIPYRFPARFPVPTLAAARAYWWMEAVDAVQAKGFARAVFRAYFAEGADITEPAVVAALGERHGAAAADLLAAIERPEWKQKLKDETAAALAAGVFGAPFFVVDGEPFWGWDRLPMLRQWLQRGGW